LKAGTAVEIEELERLEQERRTAQSSRQQARQQRILQVARDQITKRGYDAISMQGLADAAGVSKKTLYNLYNSKDELLRLAVEGVLNDMRQRPVLVGARSGVESLIAVCEASAEFVAQNSRYAEVIARTFFQLDPSSRVFQLLVGDARSQAESAFLISQQRGDLCAEADTSSLAELFTAHQWGLVLAWSKGLVKDEPFPMVALRSQLTTIYPVSRKRLRSWLKDKAISHHIQL